MNELWSCEGRILKMWCALNVSHWSANDMHEFVENGSGARINEVKAVKIGVSFKSLTIDVID